MADFNGIVNEFAAGQALALSSGWADERLGKIYAMIDVVGGSLPPGSTELGCLTDALKAVEQADIYIEKRQRENAA
jgi:hypothetical protein